MKMNLRLVLLEDNKFDAELLEHLLRSEGFDPDVTLCDSEAAFHAALSDSVPDLIISDFALPSYDGQQALRLARELHPEVPFIFYSGAMGEEVAIDALKSGATDYVLKQRPQRLIPAVSRALVESAERRRRKEAEEQIVAQARLLDLTTDAIIVRDLNDRIEFINHGGEKLWGYSRSELLGHRSTEFLRQPTLQQFEEAKRMTLREGHWEGEMEQYTKASKPVLVLSRWTRVVEEGKGERILAIYTDITDKKQIEKQFLRAQRLESIGTLASGIAHDLNNILAPICMATELLRGSRNPEDEPMLNLIDQSARRGADLVKQVLAFVRGSEGKRCYFSLEPLIKEIAKIARETFPRNIETRYDIQKGLWLVNGDAGQLHQVLMNLCVNARDAMPDGGRLHLSVTNVETEPGFPHVAITVTDTGTGMPPEVLDKIFDPFFTTKEATKGTGLGLSTVLGIVKSHGGNIDVESTPGQGSTFRILLPARIAAEEEAKQTPLNVPRGKGELILLVDDEASLRKVAARTLSEHGYDVISAADGSEGIVRFTERLSDIQLVITDHMMPGIDGASFIKSIRTLKPDVCIVSTTGLPDDGGPPSEANIRLRKPYSTHALLSAVSEVLVQGRG